MCKWNGVQCKLDKKWEIIYGDGMSASVLAIFESVKVTQCNKCLKI